FFFASRRRHTRFSRDWSSDVCSSDLEIMPVAVGLDHRDGELSVHGWTQASGVRLDDALGRFPTAAAFVITDISRDGMLTGPDVRSEERRVGKEWRTCWAPRH